MPLAPAITDLEHLKDRSAVAALLAWRPDAVQQARFDHDELTIWLEPSAIREACALLRDALQFNFLASITAVDWHPTHPRFEVVYHLLSITRKDRVRLKVRVGDDSAELESVISVWLAANFFEREVFDLFGVRFSGHPYLRRIMMPDDWEGHPLRKDYPVEGYR